MPKYIAKQSIGHYRPGDEIKGLESKQLQALLASGAIEEYQEPEEPKADDSATRLNKLEAEVAELKARNQLLETDKQAALTEVAELKAKVAELEKAIQPTTTSTKVEKAK